MLVNLINICYCVMKNYKVVNWCKYTNADDVVATTGIILVIKTPTNVLKLNQTNFDNIHHNEYRRN